MILLNINGLAPERLNREKVLMIFLVLVATASGADIIADLAHGASTTHLVQELFLLLLALMLLSWLVREYRLKRRELTRLQGELEQLKSETREVPAQILTARLRLGEAVTTQFSAWDLSPSEQEVGRLLLKGYSLKEIALLRERAEKTIRQQASSIYQKAGVSGRHTLTAWFLEDLL